MPENLGRPLPLGAPSSVMVIGVCNVRFQTNFAVDDGRKVGNNFTHRTHWRLLKWDKYLNQKRFLF